MKAITICTVAVAALLALPVQAKSPKRGVSENAFQYATQLEPLAPGVGWFYNWGQQPSSQEVADCDLMEYCPMAWNGGYNAEAIRNYCKTHPQAKYILGFNEPNFTNQADMTPQAAAAKWPELKAMADELGMKLVAPAMNTSPNPPYQDPTKWFDEFVAIVGLDAFDYVAVHSYGGLTAMQNIATSFHDRYGKDVWVTEFCFWPNEGNPNSYVAPATQISSMVSSLEWLEKTPWIFRYAWFKPVGLVNSSKGPNYGLLMPKNGPGPRELSEQGFVYTYMSDFDADVWHGVGELVPATEYIASSLISLGKGADEACPKPIEVSQFNAGATLDYQFDVPSAGGYTLELTVTGEGEPVRYDPNIALVAVNADGSDGAELHAGKTFTLPGNQTDYKTVTFPVTLAAGHVTLRVKDTNPYRPSGLRISTVRLVDNAGVEGVRVDSTDAPAEYYTLHGVRVERPQSGIYIERRGTAGRKVYVK